jgi:crotonobetainyl-CoA:carnitine CoA-transferase CaiB-like acyl-CoA transferase
MRQATVMRATREWIALFEQVGVPCGPINTLADVFADPQVKARGLNFTMPHPVAGDIPLVASPIRMSDTPVQYRSTPPQLGQHTREVLHDVLGLTPQHMDQLQQQGVLG